MSETIREFLISEGFPIARLRKPMKLTGYQERMRIIEENNDKPEAFRERSLRRRLSKLDRALTDAEAYALDRAFNAWLISEGKGKSVNPMAVFSPSGESALPLSQAQFNELRAFALMLRNLGAAHWVIMGRTFLAMAPWAEGQEIHIRQTRDLARCIKKAYENKIRT